MRSFSKTNVSGDDHSAFSKFKKFLEKVGGGTGKISTKKTKENTLKIIAFEKQLEKFYKATKSDKIAEFLNNRCPLLRHGRYGNLVMTRKDEMVSEIMPGNYRLTALVCFSNLPPIEPKHNVIKSVNWTRGKVPEKSGRAIFPNSLVGKIV